MLCFRELAIPFTLLAVSGCVEGQAPATETVTSFSLIERPLSNTITNRFPSPKGFIRSLHFKRTFEDYLRNLPLKQPGAQVHLYDGSLKRYQGAQAAVIDLSVGDKDLQQCADAVMRIRSEYLFSTDQKTSIQFNFTSGFSAPFSRWMKGERITVKGNECAWVASGEPSATHDDLLNYLQVVFTYAGTLSLSKELEDASSLPVQPGDVFVHGGSPGHAVIVVDVAANALGERVFMLAQSYMPAQDIHVLRNMENSELSPWHKMDQGSELHTPEWRFSWGERKRWRSP